MSHNLFVNHDSALNKFGIPALGANDDNQLPTNNNIAEALGHLPDEEMKHEEEEELGLSGDEGILHHNGASQLLKEQSAAKDRQHLTPHKAPQEEEQEAQAVTPKKHTQENAEDQDGELAQKIKSGDFLTSSNKKHQN